MIRRLCNLFLLYSKFGVLHASRVILRIIILPFWKIDRILPSYGKIVDIGCGDGGLTNYLATKSARRTLVGIDKSPERIELSRETTLGRKNIKFILSNVITMNFPKASGYLLVDVLHHIPFASQEKILHKLITKMNNNSLLVIKEVDNKNFLPYWFGYIIEKILYPKESIYTRSKGEWLTLLSSLNLSCNIEGGTPVFPDSTLIFTCKEKF